MVKSLLSLKDLSKDEIIDLIKFSNNFIHDEGNFRKEDLFPDKTVANVFCEPSTRTKSSFAIAARNLGCSVIDFNIDNSSVQKGESIFETVDALNLMGVDLCVLRHPDSVIQELANTLPKMVFINAGEGSISHPTQALLDMKTIIDHKNSLDGLKIVIVGDVLHSRVALSNIFALKLQGAEVKVCGPTTLIPKYIGALGVEVETNIKKALEWCDVANVLRVQHERMAIKYFPSTREYTQLFGINKEILDSLGKDILIMHPGPINRGVEITSDVADADQSIILNQVENGVAVRMAVIYLLAQQIKR